MIGEKIFCGLDIGSQRIKASLIAIKKGQSELLGVNDVLTRGLKKASVNNLGELTDSVHSCLKGLMKKTSVKVKDVHLGLSGNFIEMRYGSAVIPLLDRGNKIITLGDVKKIDQQACLLGVNLEEKLLHKFAQSYTVDENNAVINPIGLYGRKLGTHFLLIISKVNLASNIVKAVNQAGYEVSCIAFSSILAAEASLNKKLKIDGCMVVDIGATTTSVLVFKDGFLRELDIIQLGGDHLTSGLAEALKLPLSLAEEIKKSYAAATRDDERQDQEILIKKEAEYVPLKRDAICQAIEPEVLRLVNSIENTIKCSRFQGQIDSEILMVGGGSLLSGLIERIEKAAHLPVHIGKVNIALNKLSNPVIFSAAAGLAQAGFNQSLHHILSSDDHASRTGQIKAKIKEWYQDYF